MSEVACPKCGSTQISANKKGFSGKKAVVGAILTGGIGIAAGTLGSNKIRLPVLPTDTNFAQEKEVQNLSLTLKKMNIALFQKQTRQY